MSLKHKWVFSVTGGGYLQSFATEFQGNDIGFWLEDDHMGVHVDGYSSHIDELDDPVEVATRLYSLNLLVNGSLNVYRRVLHPIPISFNQFSPCDESRGVSPVEASVIEENPFSNNPEIDLQSQADFKSYLPYRIFHLCKIDSDLRGLIFLTGLISINSPLARILTWGTLYKIYDTVKYLSKERNLDFATFASTDDLNRFTAACNNMSILGINARHGAAGNTPPTRVLTDLDEAIEMILLLVSNFVTAYIPMVHPQ